MVDYTKLLKNYHLKVTPQRLAIVQELDKKGHLSIEDLYKVLLGNFPTISLATIYKNINSMVEKLFVSEVKILDKKSVYELMKNEHAHLICSQCGMIEDIEVNLEEVSKVVSVEKTFIIENTSLNFKGLCSTCSK